MKENLIVEIKNAIYELAEKIDIPKNSFAYLWKSNEDAYPFVEIDALGNIHFKVSERGKILEDKIAKNKDELLYWIFSGISFSIACEYELKNRIENQDCRRIIFEKQNEILDKLNSNWKEKRITSQLNILKNHPFDDLASIRATYSYELRKLGYSEVEINKLVYEKYPEN
ncbi:hypothetical protein FNO01nite_33970 [Flavobacterium noncentrifugens]|uniref:Immunity protein 63 n=1 Tax=Flavobacterium noncentrifugens TaxID=1128970 RepID=A0A1G9DCS8_9FLAO|nr:Imm63 family immunity protein [Flavobacterium noncentrifugens]GEP52725.1 hypothetical protein FNO01nite_33970 [Flavobacterium noncentrifugens]SDK61663.1 Immunity protein 63 [Flavobacterium noncentrifugens]